MPMAWQRKLRNNLPTATAVQEREQVPIATGTVAPLRPTPLVFWGMMPNPRLWSILFIYTFEKLFLILSFFRQKHE